MTRRATARLLLALLAPASLFGVAGRVHACSECLCGTPFPADLLGGAIPSQFRFGLEDRYLSKTSGLDDAVGTETEREHRVSAFVLARPYDRVALLARMPWNTKEQLERTDGEPEVQARESGAGDFELQALVGMARAQGASRTAAGIVLGLEAPTGPNDRRNDDGERLDEHLQPGTGAWAGTVGVHAALVASTGTWDASILGRVNGTNAHHYGYGDVLLLNAGWTRALARGWALDAQLNGRMAQADRESGETVLHTGGSVVYAAPGVRWIGAAGIGLEAAVQFPVVQSLYGVQTEHPTARIALFGAR